MIEQELLRRSTDALCPLFERSDPADLDLLADYNFGPGVRGKSCAELVAQIRYNGSNDIAHLLGRDAEYLDIVRHVADKMNIKWMRDEDEETIEKKILGEVFSRAWQRMSPAEREPVKKMFAEQGLETEYISRLLVEGTLADFMPTVGYLVTWNIARIVALAAARGAGVEVLGGLVAGGLNLLLGPLGIMLGMVILAVDLAGPAYRKVIPTVLQIAYLRQKAGLASRPAGGPAPAGAD